jgi:hypothetical protein
MMNQYDDGLEQQCLEMSTWKSGLIASCKMANLLFLLNFLLFPGPLAGLLVMQLLHPVPRPLHRLQSKCTQKYILESF